MPDMSSDQIRDVAIKCVEGFLNEKTPLSEGLAKQASYNDLNLEQIKRACEVANTVTHLKLMQLSEDRTIEFPLCKVAEVMSSLCRPDAGVEKTATETEIEKSASAVQFEEHEYSQHEKNLQFIKEAAANEKTLELLQDRSIMVQSELVKLAAEVRSDPSWIDKMSHVMPENFYELSTLVSGEKKEPRGFASHLMFKEAELKQVNNLAALYKEAKQIVAESAKRRELCKRAEDLSSGLVKQAFFGAIGRGVSNGLGHVAKSVGSGIGKAVAAPVASLTKTIAAPVSGSIRKGLNQAADTKVGKSVGLQPKPLSLRQRATIGAITTGGSTAAAVGTDALTYASSGGAGFNSTGTSRDVWDALQH